MANDVKPSEMNIFAMRLGPGQHLQGQVLLGGVIRTEEYDHFHEVRKFRPTGTYQFLNTVQLILNLELARCGCRGYLDGFLAGGVIGLPPVLNFGSDEIKSQVVPEVLAGKKFICLAISEAFAGSDVGGLQTTAVRDGNYWVISGSKKYTSRSDPAVSMAHKLNPILDGSRTALSPITSLWHAGLRLAPSIQLPPPTLSIA